MTITKAGARCDVCGNFILPIREDEMVNPFTMSGIQGTLHCDNACKELLQSLTKNEDWVKLPEGPIRKLFEEQYGGPK